MPIWIMIGVYEGEMFCSSHFTEKGAALAAIAEVLEYLGVECEETARTVIMARSPIDAELPDGVIEWDREKLRSTDTNKLWGIFGEWGQLTWDNDHGYQIDVTKTMVTA